MKTLIRALNLIASKTQFENTSSVLEYVARGKWRDSYKANLCDFYNHYCKFYSIALSKPRYCKVNRIPRVPTEDKINLILGHASRKYVLIHKIAMECGLRPVEIGNLTANDIDLEKGLISVYSAKHGNPRVLKLKSETHALLCKYVKERELSLNDRLFPSGSAISNTYESARYDSQLKKTRLYDLTLLCNYAVFTERKTSCSSKRN